VKIAQKAVKKALKWVFFTAFFDEKRLKNAVFRLKKEDLSDFEYVLSQLSH